MFSYLDWLHVFLNGTTQGKLIGAVRALYEVPASAAELAEFGLTPEDRPEEDFFIWKENYAAFNLFYRFNTQWRVGMSGVVGLDYNVFQHEMDRLKLSDEEYDDMMYCLNIIESTAIAEINK